MALDAFSEPGTYNIKVVSGDSWRREVTIQTKTGPNTYTPIDLTGYTPQAQIRKTASNSTVLATITAVIPDPLLGVVVLTMDTSVTESLVASVWDLELDGGVSNTHTVLSGTVTVIGDVTRV
jgi:hypothetical protein